MIARAPLAITGADACCDRKGHIFLHRSWRSIIPRVLVGLALTAIVYYLTREMVNGAPSLNFVFLGQEISLSFPIALLVLLVTLARPVSLLFDCSHEIGCHHLKSTKGLLSFQREQVEIPYEDILGVRVSQNIFERILSVGRILVWTASADRPEISMGGIGSPEIGARLIKDKVDAVLIEHNQVHSKNSA